jgi:hypothetical protein
MDRSSERLPNRHKFSSLPQSKILCWLGTWPSLDVDIFYCKEKYTKMISAHGIRVCPRLYERKENVIIKRLKIDTIALGIRTLSRSQWPRSLRRGSAAARLLGLWVRMSCRRSWMSVSCECCVLSGRSLCDGLITRTEEFYRVWCV